MAYDYFPGFATGIRLSMFEFDSTYGMPASGPTDEIRVNTAGACSLPFEKHGKRVKGVLKKSIPQVGGNPKTHIASEIPKQEATRLARGVACIPVILPFLLLNF